MPVTVTHRWSLRDSLLKPATTESVISKLNPRHWYRADTYTLSGGNLATLPNRNTTVGGALNVATGTIAAPAVDSILKAHAFVTDASQILTSTLPASEFTFLHDGTGADGFIIHAPTGVAAAQQTLYATRGGGYSPPGYSAYLAASSARQVVVNGTQQTSDINVASFYAAGQAYVTESIYSESSPFESAVIANNLSATSSMGNTPTGTASTLTLQVAGVTGNSIGYAGRVAEIILFNRVLTLSERQQVREYIQDRYGIAAQAATTDDKNVMQLQPRHWYRADTNTTSGANLASLVNRGTYVGAAMNVSTGTITAPTADPSLGGAAAMTFTGTQRLTSSLTASEFKFLHDGTGFDLFIIYRQSVSSVGTGTQTLLTTQNYRLVGDTGLCAYIHNSSNGIGTAVANGSASWVIAGIGTPNAVVGRNDCSERAYGSTAAPVAFQDINGTVAIQATESSAPSTSNPSKTLSIGASQAQAAGWECFNGAIADVIIFNRRLLPYERQQVREYVQSRYGIAATTVTAQDRNVLKLNPFSWTRADYYSTSGGKATAFLDKSLPGHAMTQGTVANQASNPAADGYMNNQLAANFSAHRYGSSFPLAAWDFFTLYGKAYEVFLVANWKGPNPSVTEILLTTRSASGGSGASFGRLTTGQSCHQTQTASVGIVPTSSTGPVMTGIAVVQDFYASSTGYLTRVVKTDTSSGALSAAPDGVAPLGTLYLGARDSGLAPANCYWAEALIFNRVLTAAERAEVRKYMFARYGL